MTSGSKPRRKPYDQLTEKQQEERLQQVAQHLKEGHSHIPWHRDRAAQRGEKYWLDLAESCPNL